MIPEYIIHHDILQVTHLLGEQLLQYKNSDAVLVAVPRGGVEVGYHLANMLNIPMEVSPCKKIKHPAYSNQSVGAVSIDDAIIKEECRNIPQDYIYHQIILLQHTLRADCDYYRTGRKAMNLTGKTVILVDDLMQSGDTLRACIKSIKKQNPLKIIAAVLVTSPEAAIQVSAEADDFISLRIDKSNYSQLHFSTITSEGVRDLLNLSLNIAKRKQPSF